MAKIIEEVRLIFTDFKGNNNKFWNGTLFEDNTVECQWGRIGAEKPQSKPFPGVGKRFLDQKKREKLLKGYEVQKTITGTGIVKVEEVAKRDLHSIAKKQIITSDPLVDKLVERLVKANVHTIVSSTDIKFDVASGTFTTPLGIVTPDAINEARNLLVSIEKHLKNDWKDENETNNVISKYLRLIPQKIHGRLEIAKIFPDAESIRKQSDILDSLEASYNAVTKDPKKPTVKAKEEKVFSLKLTLADDKELEAIRRLYKKTYNTIHSSSRLEVKKVYIVEIPPMAETFETKKKRMKDPNVMRLWHGTKSANLLSILKNGLKISPPSTAGITGKMFGNGIYFSDQSTKSLNYASGYWDGSRSDECFMMLCDVAMGKHYTPRSSSERLPRTDHDSTFAKAGQSGVMNNEMIVYNENQVNIVRLVEFGR